MKMICLLWAGVLLFAGCSRNEQTQLPDQHARLEKLRQQLRQTLGEKYHEPIPSATSAQLKRGSELFPELCGGCHGVRGDGKVEHPGVLLHQPSNFTDKAQATFFSEQARLYLIRKGSPGTAMMGWEEVLPEDDILALYMYVRYLCHSQEPIFFNRE
ncbi:cytochrome c [candidate division KSB1 bacterium]|nr:cytochrome c [candidate division KSB1 bacterium]